MDALLDAANTLAPGRPRKPRPGALPGPRHALAEPYLLAVRARQAAAALDAAIDVARARRSGDSEAGRAGAAAAAAQASKLDGYARMLEGVLWAGGGAAERARARAAAADALAGVADRAASGVQVPPQELRDARAAAALASGPAATRRHLELRRPGSAAPPSRRGTPRARPPERSRRRSPRPSPPRRRERGSGGPRPRGPRASPPRAGTPAG